MPAELPTSRAAAEEKVNILIVDDRPDKLLAHETVLTELNQNLVRATSGKEALRCLLKQDFAVILLDVNMPGMDGFETAALIRQRQRSETTPIIFHQRGQRHRDPCLPRLLVRGGGLHSDSGRAGNPARQDCRLCRSLQENRTGKTAGGRAGEIHSRAGGAWRKRKPRRSVSPSWRTRATCWLAHSITRRLSTVWRIWLCRGWQIFALVLAGRRRRTPPGRHGAFGFEQEPRCANWWRNFRRAGRPNTPRARDQTGKSQAVRRVATWGTGVAQMFSNERTGSWLECSLRPTSFIAVPLKTHDRALGAIVMVNTSEGRRCGPERTGARGRIGPPRCARHR